MQKMNRRTLIAGLAALIASPAIVRADSLMPISGDVYRFWQYTCPILPDPMMFDPVKRQQHYGIVTLEEYLAPYTGPNGRPYKGTWSMFGKHHNIYSDEVVGFFKEEYPAALAR